MKKLVRLFILIGIIIILINITGCQEEGVFLTSPTSSQTDSKVGTDTTIMDSVQRAKYNKNPKTIVSPSDTVKKIANNDIYVDNPGNDNDISNNIMTAYNLAHEGATLILPAGSFKVLSNLTFSKLVSLKGSGIGVTTLYRPETLSDASIQYAAIIYYSINRDTSSHLIVSGITFKSKNYTTSKASDIGVHIERAVDFVITNCRFENFGWAGVFVEHRDNLARGVIYNCQFYHNFKQSDGMELGYGVDLVGENKTWKTSANFGSNNFIFIEDNTFDYHRHSIAGDGASLYVARYNTITNNYLWNALDMHEARPNYSPGLYNYLSARASECYNNTITNSRYQNGNAIPSGENTNSDGLTPWGIFMYGGECLIFNNVITGYKVGIELGVAVDYQPTSKTYPVPYQIGYASGLAYGSSDTGMDSNHGNGDAYVWNNTFNNYNSNISDNKAFNIYGSTLLMKDRDYHLSAKPGYTPYTYPHPLRK